MNCFVPLFEMLSPAKIDNVYESILRKLENPI